MTNRKDRRAAKATGHVQNPEAQAQFQHALQHHQAGRLAEAEPLYRRILAAYPQHADSLHMLGLIAYQVNRPDIAADLIGQAVAVNGKIPSYHNNLGLALERGGRPDEAAASYRTALRLKPDMGSAHYNLGNVLRAQGRLNEAIQAYRQAVTFEPKNVEALNNLGVALKESGDFAVAVEYFSRALAIRPEHAEALINLAGAFRDAGKPEEALQCCKRAVLSRPDYADAHFGQGLALDDLRRHGEAILSYERALAFAPDRADIHYALGAALEEEGRMEDALAQYGRALDIRHDYAEPWYGRGNVFHGLERYKDAIAAYERAVALKPDHAEAHWNLSFVRLLTGDFTAGWREAEWRWRRKGVKAPDSDMPLWDGGDLRGQTVLLLCEHGMGDNIQFIRYAAFAKGKGGRVVVRCPPALLHLFETADGVDEVVTDLEPMPQHDCRCPMMSLPMIAGTEMNAIPAATPYLHADPERMRLWRDRIEAMDGSVKIGVVWRGNPQHKNDRNRSIDPSVYRRFLDRPDLSAVILQKDATQAEIQALGLEGRCLNAGPELNDFADTAALIACLDLVISVDTSVCHLAGAIGRAVWTLLPRSPDWRWLLERGDSPWYPAMRLFRQAKPGEWRDVAAEIGAALEKK